MSAENQSADSKSGKFCESNEKLHSLPCGERSYEKEQRYREVLPTLIEKHLNPAGTCGERELVAVLKLLRHVFLNVPGALDCGQIGFVLPTLSFLILHVARNSQRNQAGHIHETLFAVLSFLSQDKEELFDKFFSDAIDLIEDLAEVASFLEREPWSPSSPSLSILAFSQTFELIPHTTKSSDIKGCFVSNGDIHGIIIPLESMATWERLADGILRQIISFLCNGSRWIRNGRRQSLLSSIMSILQSSDFPTQQTCFLAMDKLIITSPDPLQLPLRELLSTVCLKLSGSVSFRTREYDTALAGLLTTLLHSQNSPSMASSFQQLCSHIPQWTVCTKSKELKVALMSVFSLLLKWQPERMLEGGPGTLLQLSQIPEISSAVCDCLQALTDLSFHGSTAHSTHGFEYLSKYQKKDFPAFLPWHKQSSENLTAVSWQNKLISGIGELQPNGAVASSHGANRALSSLRVLSGALCSYPGSILWANTVVCLGKWLHFLCSEVNLDSAAPFILSMFLEAMEKVVFLSEQQETFPCASQAGNLAWEHSLVLQALQTPWSLYSSAHSHVSVDSQLRIKTRALRLAGAVTEDSLASQLAALLSQAVADKDDRVRACAVKVVCSLAACRGLKTGQILQSLREDSSLLVQEEVVRSEGQLICSIYGAEGTEAVLIGPFSISRATECLLCGQGLSLRQTGAASLLKPCLSHLLSVLSAGEAGTVAETTLRSLNRAVCHCSAEFSPAQCEQFLEAMISLLCGPSGAAVRRLCVSTVAKLLNSPAAALLAERTTCQPGEIERGQVSILDRLRSRLSEGAQQQQSLFEIVDQFASGGLLGRGITCYCAKLLLDSLDSSSMRTRTAAAGTLLSLSWSAAPAGPSSDCRAVAALVEQLGEELLLHLGSHLVQRPLLVREFAEGSLQCSLSRLATEMQAVVVPWAVQTRNEKSVQLVAHISRHCSQRPVVVLLENWHLAVARILFSGSSEDLHSALVFLEEQTGVNPQQVMKTVLLNLLAHIVVSPQAEQRLVPLLQELSLLMIGREDLPRFLSPSFTGILALIHHRMLRSHQPHLQLLALDRLDLLLPLLGPQLPPFLPKIVALLSSVLRRPNSGSQVESPLLHRAFTSWTRFVDTIVQCCPAALPSAASLVLTAMLPFLASSTPGTVADELRGLASSVVQKLRSPGQENLLEGLPELALLPPAGNADRQQTVEQVLEQSLLLLRHQSAHVRAMATVRLRKAIQASWGEFHSQGSSAHSLLSQVLYSLLHNCCQASSAESSQWLQLESGACLAAIGALDPERLSSSLSAGVKVAHLRNGDDLMVSLISEHLAPGMSSAGDPAAQDAAALAVQELLKLKHCSLKTLGSSCSFIATQAGSGAGLHESVCGEDCLQEEQAETAQAFWSRLSDEVKEAVQPCLSSKYSLRLQSHSHTASPIYDGCLPFPLWLSHWCRQLMSLSCSPQGTIFNACKGVVRFNPSVAQYLLPHLVWDVASTASAEQRGTLLAEICAVLEDSRDSGPAELQGPAQSGQEVTRQAVFRLLDTLADWLESETKREAGSEASNVEKLFTGIPKPLLAKSSLQSKAFARSLLYYETHVRESWGTYNPAAHSSSLLQQEHVSFLLQVQSGLEEPDAMLGLRRVSQDRGYHQGLQQELLLQQRLGNWSDALACYEQALQSDSDCRASQQGLLTCLLNMGHFHAMATHVDGLLARDSLIPALQADWSARGLQAAWRLAQWDRLDSYACTYDRARAELPGRDGSERAFDRDLAEALLAFHRRDSDRVRSVVEQAREAIRRPLAGAAMESYSHSYPLLVKLHMLEELSQATALLQESCSSSQELTAPAAEVLSQWNARLQMTQSSLWTREPILALRRVVYTEVGLQQQVSQVWLELARLCRQERQLQTGRQAALQACTYGGLEARMESSKLLWASGKEHDAVAELQQGLLEAEPATAFLLGVFGSEQQEQRSSGLPSVRLAAGAEKSKAVHVGKALLRLTNWVQEKGYRTKAEVLAMYARVKEIQPQWEKSYFYLAKYCDALYVDARRRQEAGAVGAVSVQKGRGRPKQKSAGGGTAGEEGVAWWTYQVDAMLNYAKALRKGPRHLFQALPRLLTLWFDFGSTFPEDLPKQPSHVQHDHKRASDIMCAVLAQLAPFQWLTVLPQLVSRICHHSLWVAHLLRSILEEVLLRFPQQALWPMAAVSKSCVSARQAAATDIISRARQAAQSDADRRVFTQFGLFVEQMMKLCFHQGPAAGQSRSKPLSISAEFGTLKRLMPVPVAMPVLRALTLPLQLLPASASHNPFPAASQVVHIVGIHDQVDVLPSLQRPKKVSLLGSDGQLYPFLCKPKDDLRKDARMMEFVGVLNRLLLKNSASRKRRLHLRPFAVLPLSEDCGMVEWVPNTSGLRHILQNLYRSANKFDSKTNAGVKRIHDQSVSQGMGPAEMLRTRLLPLFPPVFHKWLLQAFPHPCSWLQARTAFSHSVAVWSMVGHMVGLGDRHGENILLDSLTGECVHVDFSCLFDKGLTLEKPEVVPFRLTQNVIDGFGVSGPEGVFLRTSEVTLTVLRDNREALVSVLETFIHDPLVEWTKSHKSSGSEIQNPYAERALSNIESRLRGALVGVGAAASLPFSVEGQAQRLMEEAMSHHNLGRMYIWWMPWF